MTKPIPPMTARRRIVFSNFETSTSRPRLGRSGVAFDELLEGALGHRTGHTVSYLAVLLLAAGLLGGAYLVARNMMNWRIPASIFATVAVITWAFQLYDPATRNWSAELLALAGVLGGHTQGFLAGPQRDGTTGDPGPLHGPLGDLVKRAVGTLGHVQQQIVGGVLLDGDPYRPYRLIGDSADLRRTILDRHPKAVSYPDALSPLLHGQNGPAIFPT